jgi:PPK2 family polyphosphate:nucleotide phosphotransferase
MDIAKLFRVAPGSGCNLKDWDTGSSSGLDDQDKARAELVENVQTLAHLQTMLYAENARAVLLILQGMDTSGKDGTVKHVLSGLNPMGVKVHGFGKPSVQELDHDYLWRVHARVPARGEIGVFNRSHYEDVLVVLVTGLIDRAEAKRRYRQINDFERMLSENGTVVVKCFLHISKAEQRLRLEQRLRDPEKNWKFQPGDLDARAQWDQYMKAYQDAINATSTPHAPWHVIPADRKWHRNLAVSEVLVQTLQAQRPPLAMPKPRIDPSSVRVV